MAYSFPEGAKFYFSQTFASATTVTVATNANPAVLTSATHGLVTNDEFLNTSGWEDASNMVFKANVLTANTLNPLGLDTTNTSLYSPGSGTGSIQKVSNWVELQQVLSISTSGGDPKFTTISPLAARNDINVPIGFNAASITLTMGHDAANANYQTALAVTRSLTKVAMKILLGGGSTMYGYGYLAVNEIPALNKGQANQVTASFSLLGRPISYA